MPDFREWLMPTTHHGVPSYKSQRLVLRTRSSCCGATRPALEMEASKQLHRERCRRNQQRYRERQAQKIKKLENQVSELQRVRRDQFDDVPVALGGNVDPASFATLLQQYQSSQDSPQHRIRRQVEYLMRTPERAMNDQDEQLIDMGPPPDPPSEDIAAVSHGSFSPRLTYSILGSVNPDRTMTLKIPPADIVPFLAHTPDSLAKLLYWKSLGTAVRTGRESFLEFRRGRERRRLAKPGMLTLSFMLEGVESVLKRIDFRLSFVEDRDVEDAEARDVGAAMRLHYTIIRHLEQHGVPIHDFIRAQEVQILLNNHLGDKQVAALTATAHGAIGDMKAFASHSWVEQLAARAVCFGDGPRWRRDVVLGAVQDCPYLL